MGEMDDRTVSALKATPVRAVEQGDADLAAGRYEPEARLLPPGAPVSTGPDAVPDVFQRRPDDRLLDSGKYLSVVRRPPDGAWRWAVDMWNSDAG